MNKREYRKRKIKWFEKNTEMNQKNYNQIKREWQLYQERADLNMELTRIRIIESRTMK